MGLFDLLPLTCILNGKFFCVHGGLSPELKTVEDIKKIDRFREIPKSGIFCDLMWSDPVDNNDGHCEKIVKANDVRGCSYFFGAELCKEFLQKNKLISLIRAHEAQAEGYKFYKWINNNFPTVITIFSAPNYCDVYNNKAAVIKFVVFIHRFRKMRSMSSSSISKSTLICCPTSSMCSVGLYPSWPRRSPRCCTTSSSQTKKCRLTTATK